MATTRFAPVNAALRKSIPKISSEIESSVLAKLGKKPLELFVQKDGSPFLVHRIVRYFVKALDFTPSFVTAEGRKSKSEDYKVFAFQPKYVEEVIALLNSSLFYWFWRTHSDGFHCGYADVYRIPFKSDFDQNTSKRLKQLKGSLQRDLIANSVQKQIRTQAGVITYQEFRPKRSKAILDEIDLVFAGHYGFTAEELDFIINYDIKYRLGADDDEE